jgi:catechol 2,3-dioxygenase-like lactoylglutathione lyase family enzyme
VRDVPRAARFYERWFGFREFVRHGSILFLRNETAFDLALAPDSESAAMPPWFHFGFRLGSPEAVRDLRKRMRAKRVRLWNHVDERDFVSFRCSDPDGNGIEIYWE